jgi:signal transduction histidine kinase
VELEHCPNRAKNSASALIRVIDSGIGIAPEEQEEVFQRFRQGKHYHGGSGLGLHLSRLIVEAHQGQISLQSAVQQGSTFTITLPIYQGSVESP